MKDKTKKLDKWIFFILGALIAAVLGTIRFGTPEYVIHMLSKWWI
jgi:hypothetical protein